MISEKRISLYDFNLLDIDNPDYSSLPESISYSTKENLPSCFNGITHTPELKLTIYGQLAKATEVKQLLGTSNRVSELLGNICHLRKWVIILVVPGYSSHEVLPYFLDSIL